MNIKEQIAKDLLSIGAVFLRPEDPFTWASGIKSPIYCDNRLTDTDVCRRKKSCRKCSGRNHQKRIPRCRGTDGYLHRRHCPCCHHSTSA